jgi:hypothetical protein
MYAQVVVVVAAAAALQALLLRWVWLLAPWEGLLQRVAV